MKQFFIGIFVVFLLHISVEFTFAAVYINELSTNTTSDDWVEIYVTEDTEIVGWTIKDDVNSIPVNIDGGGLGQSYPEGYYFPIQMGNKLNNSGDRVILYDNNSQIIDEFSYGDKGGPCAPAPGTNQSVGRESDGGSSLVRFQVSTKDATNDGAPKEPCPTPSPTNAPTNTPTPTSGPTNTPTPSPSPTKSPITPTATKAVFPTTKPTPTVLIVDNSIKNDTDTNSELILGESTESSPTPVKSSDSGSGSFKVGARIFLVLGLLFLGIAIITFTQKMHLLPKR